MFWKQKPSPGKLREQLIGQKKFTELVELTQTEARQAHQQGDQSSYAVWSERFREAAALAGDPYYQALRDQLGPSLPANKVGPYSNSTALIGASFSGNERLVSRLLEGGAGLEQTNAKGITALMAAADENKDKVVRLLGKAGANVQARDHRGQTALHYASWQNHIQAAAELLELGADASLLDSDGFGPLHTAAGQGALDMVRLLAMGGPPALFRFCIAQWSHWRITRKESRLSSSSTRPSPPTDW